MWNKARVKEEIKNTTKKYKHVLDCWPATIDINAPRAILQLTVKERLDILYDILEEKRPCFKCDDFSRVNY